MQSFFSQGIPDNQYAAFQRGLVQGTVSVKYANQIPTMSAIIKKQQSNVLRNKLTSLSEKYDFPLLLRYAAANNCLELAEFLLDNIPEVNINARGPKSGRTALFLACAKGHLSMVQLLTKHGAYLNALDSNGTCPASIATANQHWLVADHLAQCGALILLRQGEQLTAPNPSQFSAQQYQKILSVLQNLTNNNCRYGQQAKHVKQSLVGRFLYSRQDFQYIAGIKLSDDISTQTVLQTIGGALSPEASAFLGKWQIPTINRAALQNIEQHFHDVPFARVTDLLDSVFDSNLPCILPIAIKDIPLFEQFVNATQSLDSTTAGNIFLKVAPNLGEHVDDTAPLISWSLVIKRDYLAHSDIKQFAQQLDSELKNYSCGHIIELANINKGMISKIDAFVQDHSYKPKGP